MLKSPNAIELVDQWDVNEYEKDIVTKLIVDYDNTSPDKPIYVELNDMKGDFVIGSICAALSLKQALELSNALLRMYSHKE